MKWLSQITWGVINQILRDLAYNPKRVLGCAFWLLICFLIVILTIAAVFDGSLIKVSKDSLP